MGVQRRRMIKVEKEGVFIFMYIVLKGCVFSWGVFFGILDGA